MLYLSDAAISKLAFLLAVLYATLVFASLATYILTRQKPHSQLRQQTNAWWRIFPVVTLALCLAPLGMLLLYGLILLLVARELAHHEQRPGVFLLYCALGLLFAWLASQSQYSALIFTLAGVIIAHGIYVRPGYLLLKTFLFSACGLSFILILFHAPHISPTVIIYWLFYLFSVTALNDIAQFISGSLFGKHRIAKRISPNKTWQGLFGGMAVSVLISLGIGSYLELASTGVLVVFGLILSVAGFLGDLAFSAIKRQLQIKDFSQLIPGHGGILDRIDSLVLTAPALYFLMPLSTWKF